MRLTIARLGARGATSRIRIYSKATGKWETVVKKRNSDKTEEVEAPQRSCVESGIEIVNKDFGSDYRKNEMEIQMLSRPLYEQVFRNCTTKTSQPQAIDRYKNVLKNHGIEIGTTPPLADVNVKLPPFRGANLIEHFYEIAKEQSQPYRNLVESLVNKEPPPMPSAWKMTEGWTRYNEDGTTSAVPYPDENALVFDIEVCVREGNAPTLACAVGERCWYSWTSKALLAKKPTYRKTNVSRIYNVSEMIPMESESSTETKLIIGHNVSYDRARIQTQYNIQASPTRFLDTMSLHVCVSGVTSYQKAMLKSTKELEEDDTMWMSLSSLNNLVDVFKLYCGTESDDAISKEKRSIFVDGTMSDIKKDFQNLMTYCAKDVRATYRVIQKVFPLFTERFPHPATLAGMLELGMAYLPVNSNWFRYINESDLVYKDLDIESNYLLAKRANQACRLAHDEAYKKDLWLWDQDWSVQELKMKKTRTKKKADSAEVNAESEKVPKDANLTELTTNISDDEYRRLRRKFKYLYDTEEMLPKRKPLLAGYPAWYRKLCRKPTDPEWQPGPMDIGTGMQIAPKLLSLCWEGYPLHYIRGHGWGFLVPFTDTTDLATQLPLEQLVEKCPVLVHGGDASASETANGMAFSKLSSDVEQHLGKRDYYSKAKVNPTDGIYKGSGVWCDIELENCCWFFKLPHKNGVTHRVGNPLARDFLIKFSENVLAGDNVTSERVIKIARMLSYWRNNRDRIINQTVVGQSNNDNEQMSPDGSVLSFDGQAAILPQIVTCGTLTRRAMEPTWMTASNAQTERIGSELRSMVQAPDGYRIIGADVDSQELWIASVLGDASEAGIHGATPFGWMTLNGIKSNATDMHSVTAKAVGITRDHAKVLNYARIYGAGQVFATRLLKQFNPTISDGEAKSKAQRMFKLTKGRKLYKLRDINNDNLMRMDYTKYEAQKTCAMFGKKLEEMFMPGKWIGGTESAMFNCLESIAEMEQPKTPFLDCRLSRALEPQPGTEDRYLPTRINWVVQSGAVDFLHLMLVCMRWLMADNIRFCLSFHDEVRYLVRDEHAYKAALAMHMTNLLTRSYCVMRVGLNDLPQSIAFFTSVEVDRALRKEAQMDCTTPSNPHGLQAGYGIPLGEPLDVEQAIEKAGGNDMNEWEWHKPKE